MTNKDWLLKSKAIKVEDVCPHRVGSAQFDAWLEAEHEPRFKVSDIIAGLPRSPFTVNIVVGMDLAKRQYTVRYFDESYDNTLNVMSRWFDDTIDFDDDGDLHLIGKADEEVLKGFAA